MPTNSFAGKVVLITGASSGIGEALARQFAKQGAKVALLARRANKLSHIVDEINALGQKAIAITADVTQQKDLSTALEIVHQNFGLVDIVIANAGFGVVGNFETLTVEDYQRQFETNVYGVLNTLYTTLIDLKNTQGHMVLIGSVAGYVCWPKTSPYSMSKFALRALAQSLYVELASYNISVTLVSPGFVKTEIRNVDNQGVFNPDVKDPVPVWLRISATEAADQIISGILKRKREIVVTFHAKVGLLLNRIFPNMLLWLLRYRNLSKRKK
ncbi:MAG: SDR family NAD(P)-dependent oxidoreductase [Candidatus Berkiellales bacterium]